MEQTKVEIVMVSGACCVPSLAKTEQDLEKRIWLTVEELGLDAEVNAVSLGSVLAGNDSLSKEQSQVIQVLFQKYGTKFAPAVLVDKRVLFAGNAPAPDKLKEILEAL